MMMIDAHQHFWRFNAPEYPWIADDAVALRRDLLPEDLQKIADATGITGVVSVQARQTMSETEWLLELASDSDLIRGVVGWVDLQDKCVGDDLARFAANPKLKGVRHVVQDETDEGFLARPAFNRGLRALHRLSLAYDLLIYARQLPAAIAFVDAHPHQVFVLDHLAKPRIRDGEFADWARDLRELGRRANVCAKISGLVTEAGSGANLDHLRRYLDHALEVFGPRRLMFGSDWPVCLLRSSYEEWWRLVSEWAGRLSLPERAQILGQTAMEVYRL